MAQLKYWDGSAWQIAATGVVGPTGPTGPTGPALSTSWTTYTPTNSGITLGNGTQTARYAKSGKTVYVSYRLVLGSTSSFSGDIRVGLPSTCNSSTTCVVICTDAGVATYTALGNVEPTNTNVLIRPINVGGTYGGWDNGLGGAFTWNTNDVMQFFLTYEES